MKNLLLFKINGEIEKKITKYKNFSESSGEFILQLNLDLNLTFTDYVKYKNYIILHNNKLNEELNKTIFYFTNDRFNGDVALIKVGDDNLVKNLTIDEYFKKLTKSLQETQQRGNNSNSECDIYSDSDVDLSMYGEILIKEPFDY